MARRPLILHVDDEQAIRDLVHETLSSDGMEVMGAEDELGGIQLAMGRRPDVILLDVHMSEADGYESCIAFRALPGLSDIPIVMLTGFKDAEHRAEAMSCGASDYITKPIETEVLTATVRKWLR